MAVDATGDHKLPAAPAASRLRRAAKDEREDRAEIKPHKKRGERFQKRARADEEPRKWARTHGSFSSGGSTQCFRNWLLHPGRGQCIAAQMDNLRSGKVVCAKVMAGGLYRCYHMSVPIVGQINTCHHHHHHRQTWAPSADPARSPTTYRGRRPEVSSSRASCRAAANGLRSRTPRLRAVRAATLTVCFGPMSTR